MTRERIKKRMALQEVCCGFKSGQRLCEEVSYVFAGIQN